MRTAAHKDTKFVLQSTTQVKTKRSPTSHHPCKDFSPTRSLSCVVNRRRTKRNPTSHHPCMDFRPTRSLSCVANPKRSKIRPTIPLESVRTAVHEVCVAVAFPSQRRSKLRHHIIPLMDLAIQNHSIETDPSFHLATDQRLHPWIESVRTAVQKETKYVLQSPPQVRTKRTPDIASLCMDFADWNHRHHTHIPFSIHADIVSCQRRSKIRHRISP